MDDITYEELDRELSSTIDASVWAKRFVQMHGGDEDLMIAWFANAIMVGYDKGRRDSEAEDGKS